MALTISRSSFSVLTLIALCLAVSPYIQQVQALVPAIVSVTTFASGDHTVLNITVDHFPSPPLGPSHYVNLIELDINGTIQNLNQSPQFTQTFVVQHDLGVVQDVLIIRVRAHCTVHDFSPQSSPITIPEYSLSSIVLLLVMAAAAVLTVKIRVSQKNPRV